MHTDAACSCNERLHLLFFATYCIDLRALSTWSVLITNTHHTKRGCYSIPTELRNRQDQAPSLLTTLRSVRTGLHGASISTRARRHHSRKGLTSTIDPRNQIEAVQGRIGCGIYEISDSTGGMVYPCIGCDTSLGRQSERVVCSGCDRDLWVDKFCIRERRWCVLKTC